MRLKLSLRRASGAVDLDIVADATATAGYVARLLRESDPTEQGASGDALTLRVTDPFGAAAVRTIDADATMADSGLLSGSVIELVPAARDFASAAERRGPAAARIRVLEGPDSGKEFEIPAGATVIGRDRDVDVRLSDPMVSKRHARVNIAESIEIIDLNSANGVLVSGDTIGRAPVGASDVIVLGDTSLCVVPLVQSVRESTTPQIEHVRSPRVVPHYPGEEFPTPTPPKFPQRQRFPLVALVAPLIMGAVLFAITQQLLGVLLMAMSPLLLIGAFIDQSLTARRELKAQRAAFDEGMLRTQERLESAHEEERRARIQEAPSLTDLQVEARRLGPLLWSERPELPGFLSVRAGLGRAASRSRVALPATQDTLPECWDQLLSLAEDFRTIDGVPIVVQLRESGSLGVSGGEAAADVGRGVIFQLAARHSPAELAIAGVISPAHRGEWEWLKWLPHTSSAHSPLVGPHLADGRAAGSALLARIEELIDARTDGGPEHRGPIDPTERNPLATPVVPAVVLLVDNSAPVDRARLTRVVERGPDAGVHVVWIAPRVELLPAGCRSFLSVDPARSRDGVVGEVRHSERTAPVEFETLDKTTAEQLARMLAPVVDAGVPEVDDSDLPRAVAYPELAGRDLLDAPESVIERWRQTNSITPRDGRAPVPRKKEGSLRAVVGHAGAEPFVLDLRTDGPHALVGGTTGAGKSEFLQSWVLGMAAAHSPDRLTFLFVDYKGGSAFADCVTLPHTVGLVTDLSPHLVRRALTSLRAELRHREHLLNAKKAKDLASLEKRGDPDCPPSLVIIVDEFAALVQEVPEFVDGVVDVAQRGRSLGLHLVLATQRPAGVIRDNLRANTNLRIALRMADADDSVDILGDRMAAGFDPSIPGRGAAKTGPGRLRTFQTGYVGGRTTDRPPQPRAEIRELDLGGHARWEPPVVENAEPAEAGRTDIARIVDTIRQASSSVAIPAPRKPWLDELASVYSFERLANPRTDARLPIGVIDDPSSQSQPNVFYEPDRDGNLAIFGTGGSGKSAALRTIAIAAALTSRNGGPTHVYGLDFGARGLSMLESLPHVGAIVSGDDDERVVRLLRMLRDIVEDRASRYAAVNAGSIGEYRRIAGAPLEPRILLLVDGIGAFKEQYEFGPASAAEWFTAFAQIAADGMPLGVHLVMTGNRPNAVPASIDSTVQRRIVLRMSSEDDYMLLGVPKDVLGSSSPPGRGILDGREVQLAILGESSNVAIQARRTQAVASTMASLDIPWPAPVLRLPEQVELAELPTGSPGRPVIGVDDVTLGGASVDASGTLMLAGPPASGRTVALATIAASAARSEPGIRRVLLSPRRSTIGHLGWDVVAQSAPEVLAAVSQLIADIESHRAPRTLIAIESLPEFTATEAEFELDRLIRLASREGHFVVGEGETSTWSSAYTLAQPFRAGRHGLLLVPGEMDGDTLLGTSLGRIRRADFPPGRGFLISRGRARKLHLAVAEQTAGQ